MKFSNNLLEQYYNFKLADTCDHRVQNNFSQCVDCLTTFYRTESKKYMDKYAPTVEKLVYVSDKTNNAWYNEEICEAKRKCRKAERNLYKWNTEQCRSEYARLRQEKCNIVENAKRQYYNSQIDNCSGDSRQLQNLLNNLLGKNLNSEKLPHHDDKFLLAEKFKDFFVNKIDQIRNSFQPINNSPLVSYIPDFPLS